MLKGIIHFVLLAIGMAACLTLLLIFVAIWIGGSIGLEEDNIFIRSLETAVLVFGVIGLGIMWWKQLDSLVNEAEQRKLRSRGDKSHGTKV